MANHTFLRAWILIVISVFFLAQPPLLAAPPAEGLAGKTAVTPHIADPDQLFPPGAALFAELEAKLQTFEHTSSIKVIIRVQAHSPSASEDEKPGVYMRGQSTRLGLNRDGILAVFFADDPDWRLWIGETLTPVFSGHPGTPSDQIKNDDIHDAKEALFARAWAQAATTLPVPAPAPASPAHIAAQARALADQLIQKFSVK